MIVYGYIEGREDESLAYFEALLSTTDEPEKRIQLERMIGNLRNILARDDRQSSTSRDSVTYVCTSNEALNSV
jgi:hypothetical protein